MRLPPTHYFIHFLQAFASPAKLAEMVSRVNEALSGPLPQAVSRMRLYLPNPGTHAILFKPVKSNLVEAHSQVGDLCPPHSRSVH